MCLENDLELDFIVIIFIFYPAYNLCLLIGGFDPPNVVNYIHVLNLSFCDFNFFFFWPILWFIFDLIAFILWIYFFHIAHIFPLATVAAVYFISPFLVIITNIK